jgi:hypothetical protein
MHKVRTFRRTDSAKPRDSDQRVDSLVRQVLNSSPWAALTQVDHEIDGHVIRLSGAVSSFYLKQMAQSVVARACTGFRVENGIAVVQDS